MADRKDRGTIDEGTKDSKLDKVFWFKVALSLIMGISFGAFKLAGFLTFVIYFVVSIILTSMYFNKFVSSDDIDYQAEVFTEGLNVSVPLFLLCWIMTYTMNKLLIQPQGQVQTQVDL